MFGKRTVNKLVAFPVIIVPQSAYDSDKAYALPEAVVDFVNYVIHTAHYRRDELPAPTMQIFHVDYYVAQVNNGGHSQYVGNSGWHQYQIDDIRAGLAAIGEIDAIELFEDLCAFADSHPGEFQAGMEARGFGAYPEFFAKADKLFFAGLNDRIMQGNSDRVRALDCLLVLGSEEYRKVMNELPARNPLREQRAAELARIAEEGRNADPIMQACRCLGRISPPNPVLVNRWLKMVPKDRDNGERGYHIAVELEDGSLAAAYLFPTFGMLVRPGENGSTRVGIDVIQEWVKEATGNYIPRDFWR